MKTTLARVLSVLVVSTSAMTAHAATATAPAVPAPPPLILSTPFVYGGAMQTTGRCSIFNAGGTAVTVLDIHAEDGQGNTLISKDAKACNKALAGARACTVTFEVKANDDGTFCVTKIKLPAPPAPKANATAAKITLPPLPVSTLELLDNAGNVLVYTQGILPPPPPAPDQNKQGGAQGGAGTPPQGGAGTPPQGGTGTPPQGGAGTPPQGGAGTPPQGGAGTPPPGGAGTPPPQGGNGGLPPQ